MEKRKSKIDEWIIRMLAPKVKKGQNINRK